MEIDLQHAEVASLQSAGQIGCESPVKSILPSSFYLDPPDIVARNLIGRLLIREIDGHRLVGRIVETEAYFGRDDPAAHSFAGKTARNAVIFGPPGRAYVYFIYGMHYCLNVACEPEGQAGCVLIRALEPVAGLDTMTRLRGLKKLEPARSLTSGPGRLCQAFGITRQSHNGADLTSPDSDLRIEADGRDEVTVPGSVAVSPRIGIRKAATRPLRFFIAGNRFVSAAQSTRLSSAE